MSQSVMTMGIGTRLSLAVAVVAGLLLLVFWAV